jgi:hypothetical protein
MNSYEEELGEICMPRLRVNDGSTPADPADPRYTGRVSLDPLLAYIDDPANAEDWEHEAAARDRHAHRSLLRALRAPLHAASASVQRVQADSTLAALHGAVL